MNQKKAKLLRKLAGPKDVTKYMVDKPTVRKKFMELHTGAINTDGTPSMKRIEFITGSLLLVGSRKIYKILKNRYKNATRNAPVNMMGMQAMS